MLAGVKMQVMRLTMLVSVLVVIPNIVFLFLNQYIHKNSASQ
jgi:hypothetical protein